MAEAGDWKAPDESEAQQQFPEQGPQCTRSPGIKNEPGGGRGGEEGARRMHTQPRPGPGGLQSPAATWLRRGGERKKKKRKKKSPHSPQSPQRAGGSFSHFAHSHSPRLPPSSRGGAGGAAAVSVPQQLVPGRRGRGGGGGPAPPRSPRPLRDPAARRRQR